MISPVSGSYKEAAIIFITPVEETVLVLIRFVITDFRKIRCPESRASDNIILERLIRISEALYMDGLS